MKNVWRIGVILVLVIIFVIVAQRLDQLTGPPATPSPGGSGQELAEPASATATPEGYPFLPTETPEGPYPPPKPTPTPTPEGYQPPTG